MKHKLKNLILASSLCVLCVLSRPTNAQSSGLITNGLPGFSTNTQITLAPPTGLPAPVQSVLDFVPTINASSTTLANTSIELRVGTTTGASAKDTGAFSDIQCSYEFTKNFTVTGEVISGNIGGALEDISVTVGYLKRLGNFEISPHIGAGWLVNDHKVNIDPGLLLEIFPIEGNRLGIYVDGTYSFLLNGQSNGQIKGGCVYAF